MSSANLHVPVNLPGDAEYYGSSEAERRRARLPVSFDVLFRTTDDSGAVCFHDAWWVPGDKLPIHLDVMTVHHPAYYQHGAVQHPQPPRQRLIGLFGLGLARCAPF